MNELTIFNNEEFGEIRTIEIDGKPYFMATDIAKALGYARPADAVTAHCKGSVKHRVLTSGGEQDAKFIPEGDVYRLIVRSNLPSAESFERWVFDEVLPQIRQTGSYHLPQTYKEALQELLAKVEENERLSTEVIAMNNRIEEMKPKVSYYDEILSSKDTVLVTQIAKDYGMSAKSFNKLLYDLGVQYKVNGQWVLCWKYQGNGYVHSHTHEFEKYNGEIGTKMSTEWTQKGRLFLYDFLKKHGKLPLIEQEGATV